MPEFNVDIPSASSKATDLTLPPAATVEAPKYTIDGTFSPTSITPFSVGNVPAFVLLSPEINLPDAPDVGTLPAAPTSVSLTQPVIPDAPAITLPSVPSFTAIAVPSVPSYETPNFDLVAPANNLTLPSATMSYAEVGYSSDVMDAIDVELLSRLRTGGYGLQVYDERAKWESGRAKLIEDNEQTSHELMSAAAARGFMFPPGDLLMRLGQADRDLQDKVSALNREVMQQRADQYVSNARMSVEKGLQIDGVRHGRFDSSREQALEAAKVVADNAFRVFEAGVRNVSAQLEQYQIAATVFESRIRAAAFSLDVFKARVEAAQIDVSVQKVLAQIYRTQLAGAQTYVNIYKTQMEAIAIAASIEKLKLDAFKSKVDAYTARVNASVVANQVYEAGISGASASVRAYQATTEAQRARVDGAVAQIEGQDAAARATVRAYQAKLEAQNVKIAAYRAELEAHQIYMEGLLEGYGLDVDAYRAICGNNARLARTGTSILKSQAQVDIAKLRVGINNKLGQGGIDVSRATIISSQSIAFDQETSALLISTLQLASAAKLSTSQIASSQLITALQIASTAVLVSAQNVSALTIAGLQDASSLRLTNAQTSAAADISAAQNEFSQSASAASNASGLKVTTQQNTSSQTLAGESNSSALNITLAALSEKFVAETRQTASSIRIANARIAAETELSRDQYDISTNLNSETDRIKSGINVYAESLATIELANAQLLQKARIKIAAA